MTPFVSLSDRNVLFCHGLHGHDDHDNPDHRSPGHHHRDYHDRQEHHHQDAGDDEPRGLLAADYDHGGGPRPDGGKFGPGGRRQRVTFIQGSHSEDGPLQSPADDGCLLAQDQAGPGLQNGVSAWNNR